MSRRLSWLAALPAVLGLVVACSAQPADTSGDGQDDTGAATSPTDPTTASASTPPAGASAGGDAGASCPYTGAPIDTSAFATCGDGGVCIPSAVVPKDQQSRLATCPAKDGSSGFCVPQKIVAAAGDYLPQSCKSLDGAEGRCESIVFPDLAAEKDSLPVDACDANERCAPCYDPVSGADTGACRSVSCDAPKEPAKVFASCCMQSGKDNGRCVPKSSVPASQQSGLDQKECDADSLCAPSETLDPKWVPTKCTASAILGKYDGVCVSTCVDQSFLTEIGTAQGNCGAEHFCAPCKNPLTGASTGAPGCGP